MEILELKNKITEVKKIHWMDLKQVEYGRRVSKHEDTSIEIIHSEEQRENYCRKMNKASGTISSNWTPM